MEEKGKIEYQGLFSAIKENLNPKRFSKNTKNMMYLWILYVVLVIICLLIPADRIYATALTLLPIVTMFIYVIVSKDFVQGFVFGTLLAYLAYYKISGAATFVDDITNTLADYDTMFTILTFFVCGGTISALTDSGAAKSFGKWVASKIKNEKVSLIVTWLLTLGLSIDDYIDSWNCNDSYYRCTENSSRDAGIYLTFQQFGSWAFLSNG